MIDRCRVFYTSVLYATAKETIHLLNQNLSRSSEYFAKIRNVYNIRDTLLSGTEKFIDPNL